MDSSGKKHDMSFQSFSMMAHLSKEIMITYFQKGMEFHIPWNFCEYYLFLEKSIFNKSWSTGKFLSLLIKPKWSICPKDLEIHPWLKGFQLPIDYPP